jgi:hypothetical protein
LEKLVYSEAFQCLHCRQSVYRRRRILQFPGSFAGSWFTRCPQCARTEVMRARNVDRIDRTSGHVLSQVQRWLGAPLYKCRACRLQYYDWRGRRISDGSDAGERDLARP